MNLKDIEVGKVNGIPSFCRVRRSRGMLSLPFPAAEALAILIADKEPQAALLFINTKRSSWLSATHAPP